MSANTTARPSRPHARIPSLDDYQAASNIAGAAVVAVKTIAVALQAGEDEVWDFERRPTEGDVGLLWSFCADVRSQIKKLAGMVDDLEFVLGELDEARLGERDEEGAL
jgi:hypothetical protein